MGPEDDKGRDLDTVPAEPAARCLNCGTALGGQYCAACGQRASGRLISLWQLLREAFGDLFDLDSRLWRTLCPLLLKPGLLTYDYLRGRRARYMPPFRMYLVLSLIFFVTAFFDPARNLGIWLEDPDDPAEIVVTTGDSSTAADSGSDANTRDDDEDRFLFDNCDDITISDEEDMPHWAKRLFTDERIKLLCERNNERGVENFFEAILDAIPVALILLLPFMAFVLKILYPLSRRYFVEHLLFFVHFHAFLFLLLTLEVLFARLMALVGLGGAVSTTVLVAASFYVPVYLYRAMRKVYGQGHLATTGKFLLMTGTYIGGAIATLIILLVYTVLTA